MRSQLRLRGPKGQFLVGNFNQFNRDPLAFLLEQRHYGDLTQFHAGLNPIIVVNHPDLTHNVLVTHAAKYHKRDVSKRVMSSIIGNGLVVSDGEFWKRQRRLMQPAFHSNRIGAYGEIMVGYAADLADSWQDGEMRAIDQDMNTLTMRIIAKTLFDADMADAPVEVIETGQQAMALVEAGFRQILPIPYWLPTPYNRSLRTVRERFDRLIQKFIDDRRASAEDKGDFLSLLLMSHDEDNSTMTDQQVRDEAKTLFGGGNETTAINLTWIWYLLSQHPQIAAKLHEELDRVLAGRLPRIEDLQALTYTEQIVKESMRLYPPSLTVTRQVHEDVMLGGYHLKPKQMVLVNIYGIHRDPRFFAEPERFNPDRFSPENEKALPKYAYLPFGIGPRVCIGSAFALMESRLLLATLAQRFDLSLAPDCVVVPERRFSVRPKNGLTMFVKRRG